MKIFFKISMVLIISMLTCIIGFSQMITYPIVDTDVSDFYSDEAIISAPPVGQPFYGQDATYSGNIPSYTDNGDGTITDQITGLMWEQDMGEKITHAEAFSKAASSSLGGHSDWRVPTIKELYSLIVFTGQVANENAITMFINTTYFNQPIGNTAIGEREIDAQTWSSTQYIGLTMMGDTTVFGVNFVDGRIKGYPKYQPGPTPGDASTMYFRMVRNNLSYGINDFLDNNDGTVTDNATGLMWQKADDGTTRDWETSISYAEGLSLGGHDDWRLPNAKELQSILDYTRCPDITNSPAIDPVFDCTSFNDPEGNAGQYGYYWTGTTHLDGANPYESAVYVAFGEAQGQMEMPQNSGNFNLLDVHGAGSQRSDPKSGSIDDYPEYWGPQGDVRYVYNYARCVRNVAVDASINNTEKIHLNIYPHPAKDKLVISLEYEIKTITVFTLVGEKILEISVNQKEFTIDTAQLPNGVYFVNANTKNEMTGIKKIVISR